MIMFVGLDLMGTFVSSEATLGVGSRSTSEGGQRTVLDKTGYIARY